MTTEVVIQLVTSFGIIPALFVWLLMYIMAENKKDKEESRKREAALIEESRSRESSLMEESRKRENTLMEHISKSDSVLTEIMKSVENINNSMCTVQIDVAILKER